MIKDVGQKKIPSLGVPIENSDPNLLAANILSGVSIFGIAGTSSPVARGSFNGNSGSVTVSGLAFTPNYIFVQGNYYNGSNFSVYEYVYDKDNSWSKNALRNYTWLTGTFSGSVSGSVSNAGNYISVGTNAFTVNNTQSSSYSYTWFAWT